MISNICKIKTTNQSIWLDNIQRKELEDGTIQKYIDIDGISGITSNPTIFNNSISKSNDYDKQIKELKNESPEFIYRRLSLDDIKKAAELFLPVFNSTNGRDGFVSIELNPFYSSDIQNSIEEGEEIFNSLNMPNVMIKVPATAEGISITRELISKGINVNVTLLFSPDYYQHAAAAYIDGLDKRRKENKDISNIYSVTSFFVSRIDTEMDSIIDKIDDPLASELKGRMAIDIAKVIFNIHKSMFSSTKFKMLVKYGANIQRLLWASTGTKNPRYSDVKYIESLMISDTINTIPPKTLEFFNIFGEVKQVDDLSPISSLESLNKIRCFSVNTESIFNKLLSEGILSFQNSYVELIDSIIEKRKILT